MKKNQINFQVVIGSKPENMLEKVSTFEPDVIVCPLMKTRIPPEVYNNYLTLIVHPGPPGDKGASSLDWCVKDKFEKWGVTVLEATKNFDAGLIWGFSTFSVKNSDTKSSIYRNQVQFAAIDAINSALSKYVF